VGGEGGDLEGVDMSVGYTKEELEKIKAIEEEDLRKKSIEQRMNGLSRTKQKELRRKQKRSERSKWYLR